MHETETVRVALRFANEINRHDVEGLLALMSEDHVFVDSLGQEVHGKDRLRESWTAYFGLFPDYHIDIREWFQQGPVVAMIGTARGTFAVAGELPVQNRWKVPAAWRATVQQSKIVSWQIYADNEPVWKVMHVKRY